MEPELFEFLLQPRGQTGVHARTAREDNGLVQRGADVDVGGLDGVEQEFRNARLLDVNEVGLEETFGGFEAFAANADHAAVGEGVGFDQHGGVFGQSLVQREVVGNVAELLFDLADGLEIGGSVEGVASTEEKGDQVSRHIATGDVQTSGEMVEHGRLVDGDNMGDTVAGIHDDTGGETLGVEGQDGLDGHVDAAEVVLLKHDLTHLLAILERVHGRFRQEDLPAGGVDFELLVECKVPQVQHIIPFLDDSIFHLFAQPQRGVLLAMGTERIVTVADEWSRHIQDS